MGRCCQVKMKQMSKVGVGAETVASGCGVKACPTLLQRPAVALLRFSRGRARQAQLIATGMTVEVHVEVAVSLPYLLPPVAGVVALVAALVLVRAASGLRSPRAF